MKVYVDGDLPDNCKECKCKSIVTCGLSGKSVFDYMVYETLPKDCPLREISDHTKQVCEKFVQEFMLEYTMGNEPVEDIIYNVSERIQGLSAEKCKKQHNICAKKCKSSK